MNEKERDSWNERVRRLVLEYRRKGSGPELLRDCLFNLMFREIKRTIAGYSGKVGKYLQQQEITSLTWDVFTYFLQPSHTYTRYSGSLSL